MWDFPSSQRADLLFATDCLANIRLKTPRQICPGFLTGSNPLLQVPLVPKIVTKKQKEYNSSKKAKV